jgi:hypothetical protein
MTIHTHQRVEDRFYMVTGGGRSVVAANDIAGLQTRVNRVLHAAGPNAGPQGIFDASMELTRHYADAQLDGTGRTDAEGSLHRPEALTQEIGEMILQRRAPLNGRILFPLSTQVRPGAQEYRQYRGNDTAEAIIYAGGDGSDAKRVALSNTYFNHPVLYYIVALEQGWFEDLTNQFTGNTDTRRRKITSAIRALEEIQNRHTFQGGPGTFYGALHHPYVDHIVSSIDWGTVAATPEVILAQLVSWANYAAQKSSSTYQPDTMGISVSLYNHISSTYISGSDQTILERFEKVARHIKRVIPAQEYDTGFGTDHAIHLFRGGQPGVEGDRSLQLEQVMPITVLAPDVRALGTTTYMVSAFGGLNQRQVGDCLTVAVPLTP